MGSKSLIETNPYLHDQKLYEKLLVINVTSSAAVELVRISPDILRAIKAYHVSPEDLRSSQDQLRSS
jgi:hypothetical protein